MITEINKPDLNAPRFRQTVHSILNHDLMKRFKKKYPQYVDIDYKTLEKIICTHNELLWQNAIKHRDGSEFPEGLGYIFIGSCPSPRKFNVNYPLSIANSKPLRHKNFESDNFLAKIFYTNFANKYKFQNRELWQFKGTRVFTRAVGKAYPENWKNYLQVDNLAHISKMFKNSIKVDWVKKRDAVAPDEYNEFDMD